MDRFIGTHKEFFFALSVEGVPADLPMMKFGDQISYRRKLEEFMKTSERAWIITHRESYKKAVQDWIKQNKPKEFYGKWLKPTKDWHSDSLEIYFR